MAESNSPTPENIQAELVRFANALQAATANDIETFKAAAQKAAAAEVHEICDQYESYAKEISAETWKLFEATQQSKESPALMKAKLETLKAEAIKALSYNRSKRMITELELRGFKRCKVGPRDQAKNCPADSRKPPGHDRDHNDQHSDGSDS
jgi:hypothetical protein